MVARKQSTVLVTGASGFIGSHLVDALLARSYNVVGLDNFSAGSRGNLKDAAEQDAFTLVTADIRDSKVVEEACRHVDTVYHLAAVTSVAESVRDPRKYHENNVTGTLNVIMGAVAAGVHRLVFPSTAAVYGKAETVPIPETAPANPLSPYGATKVAGEVFCHTIGIANGMETRVLRLFNVYGPRQPAEGAQAGVVSRFIHHTRTGQSLTIFGDGNQTRDFIYVDDAVEAIIRAGTLAMIPPAPINVGTGHGVSIKSLAAEVQRHCPSPGLKTTFETARPGDIRHSVAAVDRLEKLLGFKARYDLATGIQRMCSRTPA
jgi:UDP-glucose 4-epimerase